MVVMDKVERWHRTSDAAISSKLVGCLMRLFVLLERTSMVIGFSTSFHRTNKRSYIGMCLDVRCQGIGS